MAEESNTTAQLQAAESTASDVKQKSQRARNIELIIAITLGLLTLACFTTQVLTVGAHTTTTETFLFNSLQFVLTSGFAWFSTRAISRMEFEQSLKRFAISAYRRIADIERMVDRLQDEVRDMIRAAPKNESTNLRVIDAIVSDTGQLVRSSISDWGDVIGEELLALERIKRLALEKVQLKTHETSVKADPGVDAALRAIDRRIWRIQRTLPPRLQLETERDDRSTRSQRTMQWLKERRNGERGFFLEAVSGGGTYPSEREIESLRTGEVLSTRKTDGGGLNVIDNERREVGRLLNASPGSYDDFVDALQELYGDTLFLEFVRLDRKKRDEDRVIHWIELKVVSPPLEDKAVPYK